MTQIPMHSAYANARGPWSTKRFVRGNERFTRALATALPLSLLLWLVIMLSVA